MTVLIKGMDMPKTCDRCKFLKWNNYFETAGCYLTDNKMFEEYSVEYRTRISDRCPLVEVPTPHGRLIDASWIDDHAYKSDMWNRETQQFDLPVIEINDLADAPTVIETEEEE